MNMTPRGSLGRWAGLLLVAVSAHAQNIYTWSGADGNFLDPTRWDAALVPGVTDIAVINNGSTATIATDAGARELGCIQLGTIQDGTESGHVIMNGGTFKIGNTAGDPKAVIGNSATLSTFIMNGGTIFFDGPDREDIAGSYSGKGVNELDWEVGERGLGRFEMHHDAVFRAADDLKVAENALGTGVTLIDGNARASLGSGISVSGGGAGAESILTIAGNAVVDAGNSMGAGSPLGHTDEGYLTVASGGSVGTVIIEDHGTLNIRRLTAREGTSTIVVRDHGQFHIFDVLAGKGYIDATTPPDRPAETGPNSTFASLAPSTATLTLQDDAQMTVNSDPLSGPTKGLAISGPRDAGNGGGTATLIIRDRASFKVLQDLALGTGAADTSDGTLEVVGPNASIIVGNNLSLAVDLDGVATPGRGTLKAVLTAPAHTTVLVTNQARIANGHLKVRLDGYAPIGGESYTLIKAASLDGQFLDTDFSEATLPGGLVWAVEYTADSVLLKVNTKTPITVTTTASSGAGSLHAALTALQPGDWIAFNIPGAGPHVIETPVDGYPLITADNVTIDGYTQPGAVANSNPILGANNAQIKIVLDSRNGNSRIMDFAGDTPNDDTGYGSGESAILGVLEATNVTVRGLSLLAVPLTGAGDVAVYGVSFAKGASGHINGCWIGVHPDGTTLAGPADGVTGFRYRGRDENNTVTNTILVSGVTIGVGKGASNPRAQFNVITGVPAIPIILEGENHRISGNFLGVFPSGNRDFNVGLDAALGGNFEGFVEIGRAGNNTVIGVDGDGVNDTEERNIIGGTVPPSMGGYDHSLEFYGQTPGTNVIVAGNYIGVGIDGTTRFTNAVPPLNAAGGTAVYRFGSNLDGVSDAVEGNVVYNNHPADLFGALSLELQLNFFTELSDTGSASVRGNQLVNNFVPPVNPLKNTGTHLVNYYTRVMADVAAGHLPEVAPTSSTTTLSGKVPLPSTGYPVVAIDVYLPDPEGIALGKAYDTAQGTTDFPDGWVQGKTFLGSFLVDGPADQNAAAGQFTFDISAWGLTAGTEVTVTANYAATAGPSEPVITSLFSKPVALVAGASSIQMQPITVGPESLTLSWTGGTPPYQVQTRSSLSTGGWTALGAPTSNTSVTVPRSGAEGYFRVQD